MSTLVIDRATLPESVSSLFSSPRVAVMRRRNDGGVTLFPIINPEGFDNDTDYLNAIPGMVDKILAADNTPDDEWEDVPADWIKRDV